MKSSTRFLMMRPLPGVLAASGLMLAWTTFAVAAPSTPATKLAAKPAKKSAQNTAAANAPKTTTAKAADAPRTKISQFSRSATTANAGASVSKVEWHNDADKTAGANAADKTDDANGNANGAASTPAPAPAADDANNNDADNGEKKDDDGGPAIVLGTRVAQTPQTDANKPGAIPDTNQQPKGTSQQPTLSTGVGPDNGDGTTPAPDGTTPATGTVTTVTPSPSTPTPAPDANALSPADAEGRQIANVRVVGNRVVSEDTVILQIAGIKPGAAFSARQAELDRRRVRDLGFFSTVDYQVVPNLQDTDKIDVIFVVVENRVVSGFKFEGVKELNAEQMKELRALITSKQGAVLSSPNVDADVKAIQEYYRKQGFAALVTDVRQEENGTVVYAVQEGTVSRIELAGLKKTKPSIVRSVIFTKSGDPFNEEKIQKDLNRIYDLGFFEDVSYKVADDPQTPGALVVTLALKEKRTGSINFGLGFDSRSKISGFAGISENNFRGEGKTVGAQVELGAQRSFNLSFGDRFVGAKNAAYTISVFSEQFFREPRSVERLFGGGSSNNDKTFNYLEQRTGLRFNYQQPLDFERTRNILYGYRFEQARLHLEDSNGNDSPVDLPTSSSGRTSAPSIGFLRDKRDLKLDPSSGGRELITLEEGLKALGGTSTFTKTDIDLRHYFPLTGARKRGEQPRLIFASRLVIGQSFGQLPAFEQYFIGGSDTVRGHDADEQFGNNQVYGNLEFRFRLQKKVQLVAFADAGKAYGGDFTSSSGQGVLYGIGVGARLTTPIGPVRLDFAQGGEGIKTHFGIGSTF